MPSAHKHARLARDIIRTADQEVRELSVSERREIEKHLNLAESRKALDALTHGGNATSVIAGGGSGSLGATPGQQFVASRGYKDVTSGQRGQSWSTGPVEVQMQAKGTLLSTPGEALTPAEYKPGVAEVLFQPLSVADVLKQSAVNGSQVRYVKESVATNAAASVSEGEPKPESTLDFEEVEAPIRKIATWLPVSDELLEDASAIQNYINSRLSLFVRVEEEKQILRGDGDSPNLRGIIGADGVNIANAGTATATLADNLFDIANNTRGSSFLDPTHLVIHPTDWARIRKLKDQQGQYFGGGPVHGPYGGPQGPASAVQFTGGKFWGLQLVVTANVGGAGTALLGDFRNGAELYRRGGLSIEATNAHEDFFRRNLNALRAEERIGLAIYRPAAFTEVRFT